MEETKKMPIEELIIESFSDMGEVFTEVEGDKIRMLIYGKPLKYTYTFDRDMLLKFLDAGHNFNEMVEGIKYELNNCKVQTY